MDEMSQFNINVLWPGHRVGDFSSQEFTKTLAKPVYCNFHVPFAQVQACSNLRIRSGALGAPNETLQFLKKRRFIRLVEFLTESAQYLFDECYRPARFILGVRVEFAGVLRRVPLLRCLRINGKKLRTSAAFKSS